MAGLLNITQERLIAAAVLFAAALVGAVAGAKPSLAIGMAIGAAFLITAFAALPVAIAIYCFEPLGVAIDESSAVGIGRDPPRHLLAREPCVGRP